MPLEYHRKCHDRDNLGTINNLVRSHLSSVASATDSPLEFQGDVKISHYSNEDGTITVWGSLDREVQCDYSLPEGYVGPPDSEYQQGFGTREMTPEELQAHLLRKEELGRDLQFQQFVLNHCGLEGKQCAEGVRFSDGTCVVRWLLDVQYTMVHESFSALLNYTGESLEVEWL